MILRLENIHGYYGDINVLQGISFGVEDGTIVALLGRNGAGKTTTMRIIMGLTPPARTGRVSFKDEEISHLPPYKIYQRGISWIPDPRRIWSKLTVLENLEIATRGNLERETWNLERIFQHFPILNERKKQMGKTLSGGEQQMLAIARALMGNPELLLMDEPTEGLAPLIVKLISDITAEIKKNGVAVLLVESNTQMALGLAGKYYIMEQGKIVFEGQNENIEQSTAIVEKFITV
jgi:branched-chain amino acid transport system ATP-binding protein